MSPAAWTAVGLIGAACATGFFGLMIAAISGARTKRIEGQLRPNGGSSLHDVVTVMASQVSFIQQSITTMHETLDEHTTELSEHKQVLEDHNRDAELWRVYLAGMGIQSPPRPA